MKAFQGIFEKKDGTIRKMVFVRIEDMPQDFIRSKIESKGTVQKRNYAEGMELVFDIEIDDWRVFNHNKMIKPLEEYEIDENLFK